MKISAVILTYNEQKHIQRCLDSLIGIVDYIYILDSYSTDETLAIASKYSNVEISQNKFVNHALQFNTALEIFDITSDWVMRIDADEYIDSECGDFLKNKLQSIDSNVKGVYFNRHINFLGRQLVYGGMSSYWILRLWRNGYGRCEQRWMDEHIVLSEGNAIKAQGKLIDYNLNDLSWWSHKHVDYSTKEAIDILTRDTKSDELEPSIFGSKSERIRFLKHRYNSMPIFLRPLIYFVYRYFFKLGFLDGKEGFLWSFFQGFWYRVLVDAKVYEIKKIAQNEGRDISLIIKDMYGYEI
ncbi:TPA: glycosyltransferase [Vibrio vulnificus]|nr:glycosyltransferase [Vibrio vulnificus]